MAGDAHMLAHIASQCNAVVDAMLCACAWHDVPPVTVSVYECGKMRPVGLFNISWLKTCLGMAVAWRAMWLDGM